MGGRFSPYLGVGLGFTHNTTSSGTVTDPCGCLTGTIAGDSNTHVAGAAMAGFSMKLRGGEQAVQGSFKDGPMTVDTGRGLYLDVGYRFLYLGEAATGPISATFTKPGPGGQTGTVSQEPEVDDIHAHDHTQQFDAPSACRQRPRRRRCAGWQTRANIP